MWSHMFAVRGLGDAAVKREDRKLQVKLYSPAFSLTRAPPIMFIAWVFYVLLTACIVIVENKGKVSGNK